MDSSLPSPSISPMNSRHSSREPTPLPIQHHMIQPNPYRLPRFWRGYIVGGLTPLLGYGMYKLGSFAKDLVYNKFHKASIQPSLIPSPTQIPTPEPTPKPLRLQNNRHK